jgi:peroxiredoxin
MAPPGSVGMNFELPSLMGEKWTLTRLKGRRLLLIFLSPTCPHSQARLSALAHLPANPPPHLPLVVIVSRGDRETNLRLMERHGVELPVLLQDDNEVAHLYYVSGTPMAYLLHGNGITEMDRIEGS